MTMRLPGAWRIPGCAESRSRACGQRRCGRLGSERSPRSEEHTSELQSPCNLVCRLLLEKKKKNLSDRPPLQVSICSRSFGSMLCRPSFLAPLSMNRLGFTRPSSHICTQAAELVYTDSL